MMVSSSSIILFEVLTFLFLFSLFFILTNITGRNWLPLCSPWVHALIRTLKTGFFVVAIVSVLQI